MTSAFSTFRSNLVATLSTGLTGYAWHSGPPPNGGLADDAAHGFVWVVRTEMDADNHYVENITCGVRMYSVFAQRLDPTMPGDPTLVEQAGEDLQTTLGPAASQLPGDPWFFEIVLIEFDYDNGYIEATITGPRWSDFAVQAG